MYLSEVSWTDVAEADTDLAVVPVGSVEQHGPHAPLGTDLIGAEAVAEAGVERYEGEVVVGPSIEVSIAEEHRQFPGTVWVSEDTFRSYVREVVDSLAYHGFDRVVLVNGHGGNTAALREVASTITRHDDAYAVQFTWFDAIDVGAMGHGGPVETSLVWHAAPGSIREERLADAAEAAAAGWGDWVRGVNLAYDTAEFAENGVIGDPSEATPERGQELLDAAAEALADVLAAVAERDVRRPADRGEE